MNSLENRQIRSKLTFLVKENAENVKNVLQDQTALSFRSCKDTTRIVTNIALTIGENSYTDIPISERQRVIDICTSLNSMSVITKTLFIASDLKGFSEGYLFNPALLKFLSQHDICLSIEVFETSN